MPNRSIIAPTNSRQGSTLTVSHIPLTFNSLWKNYPSGLIKHVDSKTGKDIFDDHCAINLSDSLHKCGVLLRSFKGTKCWACAQKDYFGKGIHAIRAQELASYLESRPFAGCPTPQRFTGATYEKAVSGRCGIIFFKNYWQRQGENGRTGDHIDLWQENRLASLGIALTFIRQTLPSFSENYLDMSDLSRSSEVLFWGIT